MKGRDKKILWPRERIESGWMVLSWDKIVLSWREHEFESSQPIVLENLCIDGAKHQLTTHRTLVLHFGRHSYYIWKDVYGDD